MSSNIMQRFQNLKSFANFRIFGGGGSKPSSKHLQNFIESLDLSVEALWLFLMTIIDQNIFELCECKKNAEKFRAVATPFPSFPNLFYNASRNLYEINTSQIALVLSCVSFN